MEDSGIDSGDTKPIPAKEDERLFQASSDSSCGSSGSVVSLALHHQTDNSSATTCVVISNGKGASGSGGSTGTPGVNTGSTRQLQRKLEARVDQAKRIHRLQEYKEKPPGLIPIQRLSIPAGKEQQPLVDWETDESEEDIANFFPLSRMKEVRHQHQELTDTFSIEEMSVSGGEDEDEDLELVPPQPLRRRFNCCELSMDKCIIL